MTQMIYSAMRTPDGTIIESTHRHDYVTHTDANGREYMLDGGHDYVRSSAWGDEEYIIHTMDEDHEIRREFFRWGSWGKDGKGPFKRIPLKDLTDEHIAAILETQEQIRGTYVEELMIAEQNYRKENPDV
jgi:hypothetical protein